MQKANTRIRSKNYRQTGFKLTGLLTIIACVCCLSCVAFPYVVGPIDASADSMPIHDPTCRLQTIDSPEGTEAYAEISYPDECTPGCIIINIANDTGSPLRNTIVRLPIDHGLVVDRRSMRRGVSLKGGGLVVDFDELEPHASNYRAIDFKITGTPDDAPRIGNIVGPRETLSRHFSTTLSRHTSLHP